MTALKASPPSGETEGGITFNLYIVEQHLPHIHIIATGGTIAGKLSGDGHGYDAGQVGIDVLLESVPELRNYAELDYEQFCNIGSQNMNEQIWLNLAKRINVVLDDDTYDAVVVTHGTDTMEETAFFLNLTIHTQKPIVLVGSMRASDDPEADGPANLLMAVKTAASKDAIGDQVLCCLGQKIFKAGSVFKYDTHAIDAFASSDYDFTLPRCISNGFYIENVNRLPQVGIIYGYGGCSTLPLQAFMDAGFDGVVLAGVGMGNFYSDVMTLAQKAVKQGMKIVHSARVPYGGVYTSIGEVDDEKYGFIASQSLNPQKARILLMLALCQTRDTEKIRRYFSESDDKE